MSEEKSVKIHVENLTKKFGDLLVLDNISFDIKKGEFVCVVGPTAVSYTHLDVYKRQVTSLPSGAIKEEGMVRSCSITCSMGIWISRIR